MNIQQLQVEAGGQTYPIYIGRGMADQLSATVRQAQADGRRCGVVVDANVAACHKEFLVAAFGDLPRIVVPSGETSKDFAQLQRICEWLAGGRLDRKSCLFAVGGGVVGDLAGFAAAVYLRGINFYQVPTTLLAMVDSSVGGKTGINLSSGKNSVGAFHQPLAVFADLDTLGTLPEREFAAGMAEIIKHGMLADVALFEQLEQQETLTAAAPALAEVVARNCAIKAEVVRKDEREQDLSGGRALLNLGHTFGHAIEAEAGYGTYLHGEAVALGLLLAARLSHQLGTVAANVPERTAALLLRYRLPVRLHTPLPVDRLMQRMQQDKKVLSGKLRLVVMRQLGAAAIVHDVPSGVISDLWSGIGAAGMISA